MSSKYLTGRYAFVIISLLVIGIGFRINYDYRQLENLIDKEANRLFKSIDSILSDDMKQEKNYQYAMRLLDLEAHVIVKKESNISPLFKIINSKIDLKQKYQTMNIEGKMYVVLNNFTLDSYRDSKEARITFAKDITEIVQTYKNSLFMIYAINFSIIFTVVLLFLRVKRNMRFLQKSLIDLNISLEEKVQQRIKEQNTLLSLFDKGDSVLFKWKNDKFWSVEFASLGVGELLGYTPEDIKTNKITYASWIHEEDLERVMLEVIEASSLKKSYFKHKPYRLITKDGDIKWVLDYTIIVKDEDEKITHYIGHISDITQLKNIEKQLLEQSKMAQMGEMISMIAHQWRQPLGAISATSIDLNMKLDLEMFDMQTQKGRQEAMSYLKASLNQIDSLVQSLTNTIDDFRNFYKPNKDAEISLINIPVQKALEILEASLKANNIEIIQEYISEEKVTLYSNELMQVILSILQNAQDNLVEKDISNAQITLKTFDTPLSSVIEVEDNGGGISKEVIEKIFDPYFSTKDEKNGTGLGLYMSRIIVEEHHSGILSVKNIKNGVCFRIELLKK